MFYHQGPGGLGQRSILQRNKGPEDQLTQFCWAYSMFLKKKKKKKSQHLKIWIFHRKIQTWASLEKEGLTPLLRGLPCLLSLNLATSHSNTDPFYFPHRALPKVFIYFICSACVSSLKILSFLREETLYVLFKAILSTLSIMGGYLEANQEMC